jgi:hypothetical protein
VSNRERLPGTVRRTVVFPTTCAPNRGEQYESQRAGDAITEVGQGIHGDLATGVGQGAAEPGSGLRAGEWGWASDFLNWWWESAEFGLPKSL